ncbi:MAG: hypothetical protein HKN47_10835 [Pirellulaceae bacterium]|nr:hypothetical protein [Pirellulaceae bacterium]
MKIIKFAFALAFCFLLVPAVGCGSGGTKVIEAPPEGQSEDAMEGMTDEEYEKEMDAAMNL